MSHYLPIDLNPKSSVSNQLISSVGMVNLTSKKAEAVMSIRSFCPREDENRGTSLKEVRKMNFNVTYHEIPFIALIFVVKPLHQTCPLKQFPVDKQTEKLCHSRFNLMSRLRRTPFLGYLAQIRCNDLFGCAFQPFL